MLSPKEWEERKSQVGASDVSKLMNFDTKGALNLWEEKTGRRESVMFENRYTIAGNITEEPCLDYAFDKLGIENGTYNDRVEHYKIKNFVVSLDGYDVENNIPIENKSIKYNTYEKNYDRYINKNKENKTYYLQLQSQISVLQSDGGWLVYNVLQESDYENPILYEPNEITQERRWHKKDKKTIKEIESRVEYMLMCMEDDKKPSEISYKTWRDENEKVFKVQNIVQGK